MSSAVSSPYGAAPPTKTMTEMKEIKNDYDAFLEPIALRFAQQVEWAIPMPRILRWWVGRYIEGLPDAYSASCFVARHPCDPVSNRLHKAYRKAFGRYYNVLEGGRSRIHDTRRNEYYLQH